MNNIKKDSVVNYLTYPQLQLLVENIIDNVNSQFNNLTYNVGRLSEKHLHFWDYNNKEIFRLNDYDIIDLLCENDIQQVENILVDTLKKLI